MKAARWHPAPNEAELLVRHSGLALHISDNYYLPGQDRDDVRQEALVGLLIGIRSFDPGRGLNFKNYLALSIRAWLGWKVRQANKQGAAPLNDAAREAWDEFGEARPIVELLIDPDSDPADVLDRRARFQEFVASFARLTAAERDALLMVYNGVPYTTLPGSKRVDNAVQRGRRKLREAA